MRLKSFGSRDTPTQAMRRRLRKSRMSVSVVAMGVPPARALVRFKSLRSRGGSDGGHRGKLEVRCESQNRDFGRASQAHIYGGRDVGNVMPSCARPGG